MKNKYINRELSWIEFNRRVLNTSMRDDIPKLEKLKFLAITESNLDEFIMVRLGYLYSNLTNKKYETYGFQSIDDEYEYVRKEVKKFKKAQNKHAMELIEELKFMNVNIIKYSDLNEKQLKKVDNKFKKSVYNLMTPIVIDALDDMPIIKNKEVQICGILRAKKEERFFNLSIPSNLDKIIALGNNNFVMLEDVIINKLTSDIFKGTEIIEVGSYQIYRADYFYSEDKSKELSILDRMKENLEIRQGRNIIWINYYNMDKRLKRLVEAKMNIDENITMDNKFMSKDVFMDLYNNITGKSKEKYKSYKPTIPERLLTGSIFDIITKEDVILHHPYDSYEPVIDFIRQASKDKDVLAIKQTIYRVSSNSPIIEALVDATKNGKDVTVLVEVRARFSEKDNIELVEYLRNNGCTVIFGVENFKVHSKMCVVVRKEGKRSKTYTHIATGNYNEVTSKLYTDISILSDDQILGRDLITLFNSIWGIDMKPELNKIIYAPITLKDTMLKGIENEIENVDKGKKGYIFIKCNGLTDKEVIDTLYKAAKRGVRIDMIVRGICSMRCMENITIKSIVGRYLEHSRIYKFHNNGSEKIYISSADLMTRNLDKRYEIMYQVKGSMKEEINNIIRITNKDTKNAFIMNSDIAYMKIEDNTCNSHKEFMKISRNRNKIKRIK